MPLESDGRDRPDTSGAGVFSSAGRFISGLIVALGCDLGPTGRDCGEGASGESLSFAIIGFPPHNNGSQTGGESSKESATADPTPSQHRTAAIMNNAHSLPLAPRNPSVRRGVNLSLRGVKSRVSRESNPQSGEIASLRSQ